MKKQFIAKLLVLAMVLSMVPVTILAASAATAGNNNDYYYSIAADTTIEELPEDGVIVAKVVGGIANLPLSKGIVEALSIDENGNVVLKVTAAGADKVSVTLSIADFIAKSENDLGLYFECSLGKVTIPASQLAKAIKDGTTLAIVMLPAVDEESLPSVTVYVDWKPVDIKGMVIEKA